MEKSGWRKKERGRGVDVCFYASSWLEMGEVSGRNTAHIKTGKCLCTDKKVSCWALEEEVGKKWNGNTNNVSDHTHIRLGKCAVLPFTSIIYFPTSYTTDINYWAIERKCVCNSYGPKFLPSACEYTLASLACMRMCVVCMLVPFNRVNVFYQRG